jgi:hypothetical protein
VVEYAKSCAAQAGGVHNAGVDELIQDDEVVLAEQGADGADGRRVAGGEAEGRFGALERRERLIQFVVGRGGRIRRRPAAP